MNYLSHFYFSGKPLDDPLYSLGLIYPDLNRDWKKLDLPVSLGEGAFNHQKADETFHTTPWFKESVLEVARKVGFTHLWQRGLAHFGVEIAFDYFVCHEISGSDFFDRVKTQLSAPCVSDFFCEFPDGQDTIEAIISCCRLESYGTRDGGLDALKRAYNKISRYDRTGEAVNFPLIYDCSWLAVATDWPENLKFLTEALKA